MLHRPPPVRRAWAESEGAVGAEVSVWEAERDKDGDAVAGRHTDAALHDDLWVGEEKGKSVLMGIW